MSESSAGRDESTALTPTGRVILGMIGLGKSTGYEIKQLVDRSTRHFWAASYGQIYPELRRLEADGLLESRSDPAGGRRRTVHALTRQGRTALDEWLRADQGLLWEMRDEGMLKLFFSDLAGPEGQLEIVAQIRAELERKHEQLAALDLQPGAVPLGPRMTLEWGLGQLGWMLEWCDEAERRLAREAAA